MRRNKIQRKERRKKFVCDDDCIDEESNRVVVFV
jgi:hypothetical protein